MLHVIFETWPEILQRVFWNAPIKDPVVETVVWMIYNTGAYHGCQEQMKVADVKTMLAQFCGYTKYFRQSKELVDEFLERVKKESEDANVRSSVARSLVLIAKGLQSNDQANFRIIGKLFEIFSKYAY